MKRLLVLVAAGLGAALWWQRRGGRPSALTGEAPIDTLSTPPKLGGDVDADLLSILACPDDKQPVTRQGDYLVCGRCKRHYPIQDGIPVMLLDEALTPEQARASSHT